MTRCLMVRSGLDWLPRREGWTFLFGVITATVLLRHLRNEIPNGLELCSPRWLFDQIRSRAKIRLDHVGGRKFRADQKV